MANRDVEIRESSIQGRGLFARQVFYPGDIVLRWDLSNTIPNERLASLSIDERPYTHPLDSETTLVVQPPERFVNHSCCNNTEVRNFCDVAISKIEIGEEITSDYGADGAGVSFDCLCGTNHCRGTIGRQ